MIQIELLENRTLLSALSASTGDFNGDGKTDVYGVDAAGGDVNVYLSDGASLTKSFWDNWGASNNWIETKVGDFNGDGRDDLLSRDSMTGELQVSISNGKGFSSSI